MNTNKPLISIIIPVYNIEEYIEKCLYSIIDQSYKNLQIIVVDDGSNDNTGRICDKIAETDARISVIHQNNQGVVSARTSGIKKAKGEFVSFIDGDDWIDLEMYSFMIENIDGCDLISTGIFREMAPEYYTIKYDEFLEGKYENDSLNEIFSKMIYEEKTHIVQPFTPWLFNKLFKTDLVKDILLKEDTSLKYGEDSIILYQYLLHIDSLKICHKCFYHYRYREESAIHKTDIYAIDKISSVYRVLESIFQCTNIRFNLIHQLQKWFVVSTLNAINERMGFNPDIHIPRFMLDISNLQNSKVILYAAGRVGQDYFRQLMDQNINVEAWVDKNYKNFSGSKYIVRPIDYIDGMDYDYIIVAVEKEELAISIKSDLIKRGVKIEKILWKKPIALY